MPDKQFLPQGEDTEERELTVTQSRQAVTLGRMRYVLAIGVVLAVLLMALVYFLGP